MINSELIHHGQVVEGVGHAGPELYYVLAAECLRLLDLRYVQALVAELSIL